MTERFTLIECNGNIEDSCTQIVYDGGEDVFELLDLLNELYEENNEEELDYFKSKCGSLEEKLFYINRENEQLKKELKELKIDNKAKDDAIDGLQEMMAHYNLGDLE